MLIVNEFTDFSELSETLAQKWLATVQESGQTCSFALAGGTTPEPLYRRFDQLFKQADQGRIDLIATDERWVSDADAQSNEGLFRQCFAGSTGKWRLISLKNSQPTPAAALPEINERINSSCPAPFSAVILGMGGDGHIASLFPNAPQLLINDSSVSCVAAYHPQTLQPRMSLSFARLLNTRAIWLVITGAEKRKVLEQADASSPIGAYLSAALANPQCQIEVFWCP